LPDETIIRQSDCVFQSDFSRTPISLRRLKHQARKTVKLKSTIRESIMDTQQNPNEPGKSNNPGQQGGQGQDRERQERERREREKQGGGQQGGGQQGGQGGGQQGGGQQGGR
jgi:hypothetical protein